MFADSSTARVAVDGYYFSVLFARPPCETPPLWDERLCNSPLKVVQRGAIHHAERCRRGAATSAVDLPRGGALCAGLGAPPLLVNASYATEATLGPVLHWRADMGPTSTTHQQHICHQFFSREGARKVPMVTWVSSRTGTCSRTAGVGLVNLLVLFPSILQNSSFSLC